MHIHILWALIIGFSAVMYTIFDGFDLGVGILLPFIRKEQQRDTMVDSITPVWDGNETWIALMGVGLFGGFAKAYSILLPALYLPLIVMILSLILRGVAMEFRFQTVGHRRRWDRAFAAGSILATFCQGIVLGNLMEGIEVHAGTSFVDTSFHFFSPFTILTGISLVVTYALSGAAWLNLKTTGPLQSTIKGFATRIAGVLAALFILIVYGRFHLPIFAPRFGLFGMAQALSGKSIVWYLATAGLLWGIVRTIKRHKDRLPFALTVILIAISAAYLVSGFWPYIVPPQLTIEDAASPPFGSTVLLYGGFIVIPIIIAYLLYSYLVFKGKVTGKDNYEPPPLPAEPAPKPVKGVINLSWPSRIIISLLGFAYFFLVLGFLGDTVALISIALLIFLFVVATLKWKR
jgi:cytochrome bd ubiquinol oxidase subunit II